MRHITKIIATGAIIALILIGNIATTLAADSAVILQYHRFGESDLPSTSVTIAQFENHIDYLQSSGYSVLPVPHILAALKAGQTLPDKTIGITIDDAARSAYDIAWPKLKKAGFPFTLFVSTDPVDQRNRNTLTWDEIRELANAGVTIGNHSAAHEYMWKMNNKEREEDLNRAQKRFREELNFAPTLFAYPFGEYDKDLSNEINKRGFEGAFGQQSGAISSSSNPMLLPRFSLNETYGNLNRFKLIVDTLALNITDLSPEDPILIENPPNIGFTLAKEYTSIADKLACFASGQGQTEIELLGPLRVEVRLKKAFLKGRNRLNCTLPGPEKRYYWLGLQFIVP